MKTRQALYFNDLKDGVIASNLENAEPKIQKNDILSISVSSLNPEATAIFNTPNLVTTNSSTATGGMVQSSGYLVNEDGNLQFPLLGNIKAEGLSKKELKEQITKYLIDKKLLVDPIVNIRHLNFRVTVLGEVAHPTVVSVPSEKISLLEAIGLAGDLTIYAKRDNVLVIREEDGKKIVKRLNLNSTELFTSPYYYLKSNDIVYAEPNKSKVASSGRSERLLPIIFSGLSFMIIVADRIIK
ncbi:MAG TPA: polysaccharide biosynthesis/export family protein [Flavitalea sp.]|nr:polysaccharide biosynthesis/export family protein [Flavitalea sp.]